MPQATAELVSLEGRVIATAISAPLTGEFRLAAPQAGMYFLRAWRIGADTARFGPVTLAEGSVFELDFLLEVKPLALSGVEVTVEAQAARLRSVGFYDRQRVTNAVFLTPETIEAIKPNQSTDLLINVPGLQLDYELVRGQRTPMFRSGMLGEQITGRRGTCYPMIYLNGSLIQTGGALQGGTPNVFDMDTIRPGDLLGIELYRSPAETPAQFTGGSAACGVIVIWTR